MHDEIVPTGKKKRVAGKSGKVAVVEIKDFILRSLEDDKAEDLICYDLVGRTSLTDFMIFASGKSSRQVTAMAEHLREKLAEMGKKARMEGRETGDWVLVDVGDVIVHLFCPDAREKYQLEEIWSPDAMEEGDGTPDDV